MKTINIQGQDFLFIIEIESQIDNSGFLFCRVLNYSIDLNNLKKILEIECFPSLIPGI